MSAGGVSSVTQDATNKVNRLIEILVAQNILSREDIDAAFAQEDIFVGTDSDQTFRAQQPDIIVTAMPLPEDEEIELLASIFGGFSDDLYGFPEE